MITQPYGIGVDGAAVVGAIVGGFAVLIVVGPVNQPEKDANSYLPDNLSMYEIA